MNKEEWADIFSKKFNEKMKQSGITQGRLALEIGCSHQAISLYANGKRIPSIYIVSKMADIFGCTIDDLIP